MPVPRAGLQASTLALTTHVGALMYDCTAVPHLARDSHASHVPEHPTVIKYVNQKERRVRRRRITGALVKKCGSSIECKTHHAGMEDQLGATQKCLNCMSWQSGANMLRLQIRWEASASEPVDGFIFVVSSAALIIISEACVVAWCLGLLCCSRGKHLVLHNMRTPCPFFIFPYSFGVTVTDRSHPGGSSFHSPHI